ncbi:hypothetical protein GCK32_020306, partial [Trichostrongylus colubriformis]
MVSRTVVRWLAAKSRAAASNAREGRNNASFIENVRSRHGSRLESLDQKLDEAEKCRLNSMTTASDLPQTLADRVLSRECRFVQVGSSVNGLSSDSSDLDLV